MIRVIIEREIAEGLEQFYESAIADLLHVMANARGYVSGESSVEIHRPNRYVVITRWTDEAAWNYWHQSSGLPAMTRLCLILNWKNNISQVHAGSSKRLHT